MYIPKAVQVLRVVSPMTGTSVESRTFICRRIFSRQFLCPRLASKKAICFFFIGFLIGIFLSFLFSTSACTGEDNFLVDIHKAFVNDDIRDRSFEATLERNSKTEENTVYSTPQVVTTQVNVNDRTQNVLKEEDGDSQNNFLFIGIMTARKYLDTRAKASFMTWVKEIPGKVVYFLGEGEEYKGDMNVVILDGVKENAYPPQKKSFAMIEYMSKHYGGKYEWYMRADDDVYVRVEELVRFLKSVDTSKPRYIGQPGFGKTLEKGKLGLVGAFCMGGPGVFMSHQIVKAVAPALPGCLQGTASGHEDTELGRCIALATGLPCSSNYQMRQLFYQNYAELNDTTSSFKKSLGKDEVSALTLHPVKAIDYTFRLHNYLQEHKIKVLKKKKAHILQQMKRLEGSLKMKADYKAKIRLLATVHGHDRDPRKEDLISHSSHLGPIVNLDNVQLLPKGNTRPGAHENTWEFIRWKTRFSITIGMGKLEYGTQHRRRLDLQEQLEREFFEETKLRTSNHKVHGTSYYRLTSKEGVEAMMHVRNKTMRSNAIQRFYVKKRFLENKYLFDFREDYTEQPKDKDIYVLLPIHKRADMYNNFLISFKKAVDGYNGGVHLRVIIFEDAQGVHKNLSKLTSSILSKHKELDIKLAFYKGPFNRGRGMMYAQKDLHPESLLLFMDVDMELNNRFLHRVAKNTMLGKTAFYPIYFVNYETRAVCYQQPNCSAILESRNEEAGLWRSFSFGIASLYKKDLIRIGGFKQDIKGWGLEDIDIYEKCFSHGLDVFRAADPSLLHRYHPRGCDPNLPEAQLKSCRDTDETMMGSVKSLYKMLEQITHKLPSKKTQFWS